MLKNIIFMIEDEEARAEAVEAVVLLKREGMNSLLAEEGLLSNAWVMLLTRENLQLEETLFVTDSACEAERIQSAGGFVAALFTRTNRKDCFIDIQYALEQIREIDTDYYRRLYERCAKIPWTILRTRRCIVREITEEDVEALYRIYAEPSITRYMEGLFEDPAEEVEYTRNYIRKVYGFYGYGMWIITRKDTGEVIGRAGVEYKADTGGLELGYMIAKPYQRQGYAEEVCRAILNYARKELGFEKIFSFVKPGNTASAGLCRKLEMVQVKSPCETQQRYLVYQKKWMD